MQPPTRGQKQVPPSFPESRIPATTPRDIMLRRMRAAGAPVPGYVGLGSVGDTLKAVAGMLVALVVLLGILALVLMLISR